MNPPPLSLQSPVDQLKGIGTTKKALMGRMGIHTVSELLCTFPRDWVDTTPCSLRQGEDGALHCFSLEILSRPYSRRIRTGKTMVTAEATDGEDRVSLCFLNQPYAAQSFSQGETLLLLGRLSHHEGKRYLFSPQRVKELWKGELLPLYPKTKGLSDGVLRSAVAQVLTLAEELEDPLPLKLRQKNDLLSLGQAVRILHAPADFRELSAAKRRLSYEGFVRYALKVLAFEQELRSHKAEPLPNLSLENFFPLLPFAPTPCQKSAMEEIARDLGQELAMSRLLQGDVGSGKTAVAAAACFLCVQNQKNAVLLAPTQILAKQHFAFFQQLFSSYPVKLVFLSGSSTASERREFNQAFEGSLPVIAIGTHALLESGAVMKNLALAITDEQQRFGVNQRSRLIEKCQSPNSLVMTATPIPRSLALFLFDQSRVSVLNQLPPGRKPIQTYLIGEDKRRRMTDFLDRQIEEGRQAYAVCPLIEEGEDPLPDVKSASELAAQLTKALPHRRIALLHGKMKDEQKDRTMADFAQGLFDILVSTTVIEVGVNVPNANVMLIENAERFGLSQLHQLRGRVGRGSHQAHCILMTPRRDVESLRRLKLLTRTNDGFAIAEYDLEHRGPGDFFGTLQSGKFESSSLLFSESSDTEAIKADALWLMENAPEARQALLQEESGFYLN